jgi:hypothetical protein
MIDAFRTVFFRYTMWFSNEGSKMPMTRVLAGKVLSRFFEDSPGVASVAISFFQIPGIGN